MLPLFSNELSADQAAQRAAMRDQCDLLRPVTTDGRYNQPTTIYEIVAHTICGLNQFGGTGVTSREVLDTTAAVVSNPILRLPAETFLESEWRVRVTHRNGKILAAPLMYDVIGDPATSGTAVIVELSTTTL